MFVLQEREGGRGKERVCACACVFVCVCVCVCVFVCVDVAVWHVCGALICEARKEGRSLCWLLSRFGFDLFVCWILLLVVSQNKRRGVVTMAYK